MASPFLSLSPVRSNIDRTGNSGASAQASRELGADESGKTRKCAQRPPQLQARRDRDVLGVAFVGCGHVAARYVEQLRRYRRVRLVGVTGLRAEPAAEFARQHGLKAYRSLAELLADPAIDIAVNLTLPYAHAEVTAQCLNAGKHVYSEKPLAMSYAEATRLIALARRREVQLASAPCTFLGEAWQTAGSILRRGTLGAVRVVYAEVNHGRIEHYHPQPEAFFAVGPVWDVAVYPLAALTSLLGPVQRVQAFGRTVVPRRVAKGGRAFRIAAPDFFLALLEIEGGPLVRLTANFCVERDTSKGGGAVEFHGDAGRLFVRDFQFFDAPIEVAAWARPYRRVTPRRKPFAGVELARGVAELADAICEKRRPRTSSEHAAHVVEAVKAIHWSAAHSGKTCVVRSRFLPPEPMPWAK